MGRHIAVLFLVLSFCPGYAQTTPHYCATMEEDSISRLKFPQRGTLAEFENDLQKKIIEIQELNKKGKIMAGVVSIPIIVHVIHNGESVGSGTNISQAQVQAQIEVLNEDFRRMVGTPGYNNNPVGADIEIEFCLSPVDQNGNQMVEPGIHRYNGGRADWTRAQIENQLKPNTFWNPNLFYNMWTVKFAASDANLLGYAQFPDKSGLTGIPESGPAATDGVVVRYQSFGSTDKGNFPVMVAPYNKGRTLSHETGHWLGLRHIWGDGPCAEDFVADTPTADGPSSGCPVGRMSCGVTNMVQNYMDYSNDACMNIFTLGQKDRMQAVIQVSPRRKSLIEANLCEPIVADVPTANFYADNLNCVLLGSQIQFTDLSSNFPSSWSWEFEGGDPASSTDRNPRIKYDIPGTFSVRLIVANSLGSDTLFIDDYINVSEEGLCGSFNNFAPEFTDTVLSLSAFGNYTGYLTGHNSAGSKAFSEFFANSCGYKYISGLSVRFGEGIVTTEDAVVNFTVWNARGLQSGPGAVIERKQVLLKQILEDISNDRPTTITFDRETPLFSRPYHVGIEIQYNSGYTLAITSSDNGEATNATSWVQDASGIWQLMTVAYGANIAMDIEPIVGANLSVQVSASKLLVAPGQEVVLNGNGASIFIWNADDGSVTNYAGPQLIVRPVQTTTYITTGSGLELCNDEASTTIYVSDNIVGTEDELSDKNISIYPNPGSGSFNLEMENNFLGEVEIKLHSLVGEEVIRTPKIFKTERLLSTSVNTSQLRPGMYLVIINMGGKGVVKKWVSR